jgi:(4S)-4-hydroxy-5-phosphonooxypentane-2,3-dione isomerase
MIGVDSSVGRANVTMIAVIVEYEIDPAKRAELISIIHEHARRTKQEEPGCVRFDVLHPVAEPGNKTADRLLIFELYRDAEAFEKHRASPNLPRYFANTKPFIKSRRPVLAEVDQPAFEPSQREK